MWHTMWPVTWPTEANENTPVARGTLSAITVGSSNLCTGPKFRAAAPNIVADQNFSVVLDLIMSRINNYPWYIILTIMNELSHIPNLTVMIMYCFHNNNPIHFTIMKNLQMIDLKFAFRSMIDRSSFDRSDRSFSRIVWPLMDRRRWGVFQYVIRCLHCIILKILKPWDLYIELCDCDEIWLPF